MQVKFAHTAVQCLTAVAQHHGVPVNPERLVDEYALGAQEPGEALLLRMSYLLWPLTKALDEAIREP